MPDSRSPELFESMGGLDYIDEVCRKVVTEYDERLVIPNLWRRRQPVCLVCPGPL